MNEYKKVRLEDVCIIPITDGTHQTPEYSNKKEGIPFLSSKDVTSKKIDWTNIKYITKELHEVLYKRITPQKDDILLAKNGTTGVAAIVETNKVFDIYVTLALLRPNKDIIHPKYLLLVINSPFCKRQFDIHLKGVGVPNLHLTDINKTEIPLPPIETQKQIATTLDKVTNVIEENKKLLEKYDLLIKSRFIEMFESKDFPKLTLDEVSTKSGEYGAQSAAIEYDANRPRYIRITDINDDGSLNNDFVSSSNPDDDINYRLSYGDFLFARMGATVGKTYAYKAGNQIYAGYLIKYKLNTNIILPDYLFSFTKLDQYWNWVNLNQSGAAQPGINAKKYGKLTIPVPPLELQQQFAAFVQQIDKSKFVVQKSLEKAETLYKSLMQEYFG